MKLYLQGGTSVSGSGVFAFRRVGGVWARMPGYFWGGSTTSDAPSPLASANFGYGTHVYGSLNGANYSVGQWTGATWDIVGGITSHELPGSLFVYDSGTGPALYAFSGDFTIDGHRTNFARFNGISWDLPTPTNGAHGQPGQQVVYDWGEGPKLIAAGAHSSQSSNNQASISYFDGTGWTDFGTSNSSGGTLTLTNLVNVYDDGRGPAVFFTGQFNDMNNVPAHDIARWDGHNWEAVPGDLTWMALPQFNSSVVMNTPRGRALALVGKTTQNGMSASHGAGTQAVEYIGCPTCYANCDLSTASPTLNVGDFMCFMNLFARRDPYANCNNDAAFDAADFQCFLNRFAAGCP